MTLLPAGVKVHLAFGYTDMRKGMDGLALLVQEVLQQDPFSGHLFVFRGRKANLIKIVFWTEPACVCSRSGWSKASSSGRRLLSQGEPWHSPPCSYRPCSRGSIGAAPSVNGGPLWRDEAAAD